MLETETNESFEGSGLNIAVGLHMLEYDVYFRGNIGKDVRQIKILKDLRAYKFPVECISIKEGEIGLFVTKNDKVLSVERGVNANPLTIKRNELMGIYAVITTELNKTTIQELLDYKWEKIFLDIGPRPHILKGIQLPQNVIKIGNALENETISCDIVKLGPDGAVKMSVKIAEESCNVKGGFKIRKVLCI